MSRLTKNVLYNVAGQGLVLVLSFIAVRFVFRSLGDDAFGLIYFSQLLTALIVSVLQLGASATVVREVASYGDGEPNYVTGLVRTASLVYWAMFVVSAVVIYFSAPFLVRDWIRLSTMDPGTATAMLRILGMAAVLVLPRLLYSSLLTGRQRLEFTSLIDVSVAAAQQAGVVILLAFHGSLFVVVYWIACCYILSIVMYVVVASRFFPAAALLPGYSADAVQRNLRYARNTMATSISGLIQSQADKLLVSKLMAVVTFGLYSFAAGVAGRAAFVSNGVAQAAFPSLSNLHRSGDRITLMVQYRKLQDLLTFGLVPIFAAFPFAAVPVFGYVFNPEAARLLLVPVGLLSLGWYLNGSLNMPYTFSLVVGRADIPARTNIIGLFVVLPVTAALVAFYGLNGAALSWVFYQVYLCVFMVPVICRECLRVNYFVWCGSVLKALTIAAVTYGIAWLAVAGMATAAARTLALLSGYVLASFVFGSIAFFVVGRDARETVVRSSRELIARGSATFQA
jgi:O-antigen/teichoic acid export membrane protein